MIKLLIISDDFTGALDTGVQFAAKGAATHVVAGQADLSPYTDGCEVLVVDAESRHLDPEAAYRAVSGLAGQARALGVCAVYKKTDSALRGNIGAELSALLETAGGERLHFVPAFPKMGRTTWEGIHYINGTPVDRSEFARDPFTPVRHPSVREIVGAQSDQPVHLLKPGEAAGTRRGILAYDAQGEADLGQIADALRGEAAPLLMAGCAGFAEQLPGLLDLEQSPPRVPEVDHRLLVVCGSLNPVSVAQCDWAAEAGAPRYTLSPAPKLDPHWPESSEARQMSHALLTACQLRPLVVLEAGGREDLVEMDDGAMRGHVAAVMGRMAKELLDQGLSSTILVTGGDTLIAFLEQLGVRALTPVCELAPGVVLSLFRYGNSLRTIISKSGGFGPARLFGDVLQTMRLYAKKENA